MKAWLKGALIGIAYWLFSVSVLFGGLLRYNNIFVKVVYWLIAPTIWIIFFTPIGHNPTSTSLWEIKFTILIIYIVIGTLIGALVGYGFKKNNKSMKGGSR